MLIALWVRLAVVIAFGIFVATQGMWLIAVIAALLTALTAWQIYSAYRQRLTDKRPQG